ncbi:MAG: SPOR domain-containing protein [Hyphomicrobiaceae bacterium]
MSQVGVAKSEGERSFSLYIVVWLCLALASLTYVSVALTRPDLLQGLQGPEPLRDAGRTAEHQGLPGQAALIERGIGDVRAQLGDIQLKLMRGELREQELASRLSSLEARLDELSAPAHAAARAPAPVAALTAPATADRVAERTERPEKGRGAAAPPAAPPVKGVTLIARAAEADAAEAEAAAKVPPRQKTGGAVETASVRPPSRAVPPFGSPEVRTEQARVNEAAKADRTGDDTVGIQLGGAPSLDSLRLNWSILADRHSDTLGGMSARYVTSDALGSTSYNLVAGPVANRAEAIRMCAKLRTQGIACRLTSFQGSAL